MAGLQHVLTLFFYLNTIIITYGARFSTLPPITCTVKDSAGSTLNCISSGSHNVCKFQDNPSDDRQHELTSSSALDEEEEKEEEEEEEEEDKISVIEKPLNSANSFIDINFPLWDSKYAAVVVTGHVHHASNRRQRCVLVKVTSQHQGHITLHDLTLPHGSYKARLFKMRNHTKAEGGGGGGRSVVVAENRFVLKMNRRREGVLSRRRRHKNTMPRLNIRQKPSIGSIVLQTLGQTQLRMDNRGGGGGGGWRQNHVLNKNNSDEITCICCNCFDFLLKYDEWTAVLTFSYTLHPDCDADCSRVNIQLYHDVERNTSTLCNTTKPQVLNAERKGTDRNTTQGTTEGYPNTDLGCYYVELKPHIHGVPQRSSSLWAEPAINVTNMEDWYTFFSLEPNPDSRSLTVRWTETQPYNFSSYYLTLHYHPSNRFNCNGQQVYPDMTIITQERIQVFQPEYAFHNMSSGWYCARVTPNDERCPLDGCGVMSSPAQQLTEPLQWVCGEGEGEGEGCGDQGVLGLTLLVVGCVLGAVVTGLTVAWVILHTWPSLSQVFNSATHYSPVPVRPSVKASGARKQIVLLVWTPQGPHGSKFGPIITAFKDILRTYSNCEVYDYLDLSSLPERQQLHLLASPTTWLDSILAQHSIKIIIVATEGAWQRQVEWKQSVPSPKKESLNQLPTPHHAHDQVLFPYLLQRLHDQPHLAGDYSRVFHIRFSDVSHSAVELGNVVSWKRYKIPEHLRSLTVSLHGGLGSASLEEPNDDQLKDLRAALTLHPHHNHNHTTTNGHPWPTLMTYSGLGQLGLNSVVKKV